MRRVLLSTTIVFAALPAMGQSMTLPIIEQQSDSTAGVGSTDKALPIGESHQSQAIHLMMQGRLDDAAKEAETALASAKQLDLRKGINQQVLASCYSVAGKVYRRQKRYEDSLKAYQSALDYWKSQSDSDSSGGRNNLVAMLLNNMGEEYVAMGQVSKAVDVLLDARSKMDESAPGYCAIFENLGMAYFKQDKLSKAEDSWKKGVEFAKKDSDRRSEVDCMCNLAGMYQKSGRLEEAQSMARQAIQQITAYFGVDDHRISMLKQIRTADSDSGSIYSGALTKSPKPAIQARDNWAMNWRQSIESGTSSMNAGNFLKASMDFQSALDIVEASQPDSKPMASTLSMLAAAYFRAGAYTRAEETLVRAIPLCKKHLSNNPQLISSLEDTLTTIRAKKGR
ncbi:MAG: tetratricopeptide repeat protein [Cyanobacteria bacterium SZAS LIN-3]|nr:tetratricopeptide repeat protein [Cyanobacteria bacterium SZAS LIN-3]